MDLKKAAATGLRTALPLSIVVLLVVNHFLWVGHYAFPFPVADDYTQIMMRLIEFSRLPEAKRWAFVFDFSGGQHRLVLLTVAVLGYLQLVGPLNFTVLILLGNLSLVIVAWGFWRYGAAGLASRRRIWHFFVICTLVFSPAYFAAFFWATGALQNLPVLALGLLAVTGFARPGYGGMLLGALGASAAALTSASGLAAFPAGVGMLLLQRRWRAALVLAAISAGAVLAYAKGMPRAPTADMLTPDGIHSLLLFWLAVAGSLAQSGDWAVWLGAVLVAGWGMLTFNGFGKSHPALWGYTLFLLGSVAAMSWGRAGLGLSEATISRYQPYSGLLVAAIYLGFISRAPEKYEKAIATVAVVGALLLYLALVIRFNPVVTNWRLTPESGYAVRAQEGGILLFPFWTFPSTSFSNFTLDEVERLGYFRPPVFADRWAIVAPDTLRTESDDTADIALNHYHETNKTTLIHGWVRSRCLDRKLYARLESNRDRILVSLPPSDEGWFRLPLRSRKRTPAYFAAAIDKSAFPAGVYRLELGCYVEDALMLVPTDKELRVSP